jgi:hypothetical protein
MIRLTSRSELGAIPAELSISRLSFRIVASPVSSFILRYRIGSKHEDDSVAVSQCGRLVMRDDFVSSLRRFTVSIFSIRCFTGSVT